MHVRMHACMYACMHDCMHACMNVCVHVCMSACLYVCVNVNCYFRLIRARTGRFDLRYDSGYDSRVWMEAENLHISTGRELSLEPDFTGPAHYQLNEPDSGHPGPIRYDSSQVHDFLSKRAL